MRGRPRQRGRRWRVPASLSRRVAVEQRQPEVTLGGQAGRAEEVGAAEGRVPVHRPLTGLRLDQVHQESSLARCARRGLVEGEDDVLLTVGPIQMGGQGTLESRRSWPR